MASGDQEDEPEINEDDDELVRVLDKEEKEMDEGDEGDDEESEKLERDVEKVEEAMEEEIKGVLKIAKPVCQVLFKVGTLGLDPLVLGILSFFFMLPLYAPFFRASFSCFLYMLLFSFSVFPPSFSSYFIAVIVISCKFSLYSYPSSENLRMQSKTQPQSYYHDGTK